MADRPIIFSAPMARALLDGRKSQTRRIARVKWEEGASPTFTRWQPERVGLQEWVLKCTDIGARIKVPYAPGDRLYVREAHFLTNKHAYRLSVGVEQSLNPADDYEACVYAEGFDHSRGGLRLRPSIHMPRWASRLTLIVTDVRVQRLQDISEADAVAEGIERLRSGRGYYDPTVSHGAVRAGHYCTTAKEAFKTLWNSLHGPDAWSANPWIVAVSFTVHRQNIDQMEPRP